MKIELSYKWSDLDKEHQFGLVTTGDAQAYIQWIWYYLEVFLGTDRRYTLYPFSLTSDWQKGKVLKSYKFHTDAERQAKLIANRINKIVNI